MCLTDLNPDVHDAEDEQARRFPDRSRTGSQRAGVNWGKAGRQVVSPSDPESDAPGP